MPGPHAQFSPSSAYRWISCPGSVALCKGLPDEEGSVYAMEGTIAQVKNQSRMSRKQNFYIITKSILTNF